MNWFMFSLLWRITWHGLAASYLWREARSIVSCAEMSNIWGPRLPSVRLITVNSNLISVLAPSSTGFKRNPPGSRPDRIQHRDYHGEQSRVRSPAPTHFSHGGGWSGSSNDQCDWNLQDEVCILGSDCMMLESKLRELEDLKRQTWQTPATLIWVKEMKIVSFRQTWTWLTDNCIYWALVRANNACNNLYEFRVLPCMYVERSL